VTWRLFSRFVGPRDEDEEKKPPLASLRPAE
jgi:hypothetical protein